MNYEFYSEVMKYREIQIKLVDQDHLKLNELHDEIFKRTLAIALQQVSERFGSPPSPFSFFVMGSAGRQEQSKWSDQDHGIIYQTENDEVKSYFLALGKEISKGLFQAGYPYCDGGVMASNLFWCKSIPEWEQQLSNWLVDSSWEAIRYLLIFLDGRSLYGEYNYVAKLKKQIFQTANQEQLLIKSLKNTLNLKKGINVLGKLLVETHGQHTGFLNVKDIGLFPYVNAVRLLAIKAEILETSTIERLENLPETWFPAGDKEFYQLQFLKLLNYRLLFGHHINYDSGHYLAINRFSKEQTKEVKEIIKSGAALFHNVRRLIEKDELYGND